MKRCACVVAASGSLCGIASAQFAGPSTLQSSYFLPSDPGSGVKVISIASNGNGVQTPDELHINLRTGVRDYRLVGIPDGTGAFRSAQDLIDGTFTFTVNHEIGVNDGRVRDHGNKGSFVSSWTIRADPNNLEVIGAKDLATQAKLWNTTDYDYDTYDSSTPMPSGFGRLCSADMAEPSAYRFGDLGTDARIHMSGEEVGAEGRGFAFIADGEEAGTTYELPWLGKFSWENGVASPYAQEKTIVIGADDATPGNMYVYVGTKQDTGNVVERAGLNNGSLYAVGVDGATKVGNQFIEDRTYVLGNSIDGRAESKPFSMIDMGSVENQTGAWLQAEGDSRGQINFLRPEDVHFVPGNRDQAVFVTTDTFNGNSRVWSMEFNDITNPESGGMFTMLADGSDLSTITGGIDSVSGLTNVKMMDNISVSRFGQVIIQEDVGNNARLGRIWLYDMADDSFLEVAIPDAALFDPSSAGFLTQDEESSGIIDAWDILGPGWWLMDIQAHYLISNETVRGGQLMAIYIPATVPAPTGVMVLGIAGAFAARRRR